MKRWIVLLMAMFLLMETAAAQVLPDAAYWLDVSGTRQMTDYAFSDEYLCDVWLYPRDARTENRIPLWLMQTLEEGYILRKQQVEGKAAYIIEDSDGLYALLLPDYQGMVMLMVQNGMVYAPTVATPTPLPTATPVPETESVFPQDNDAYHWEWVAVEKDCEFCVGGRCKECGGSGVYRLYGESVPCDPDCVACDGKGTYETREYKMVMD